MSTPALDSAAPVTVPRTPMQPHNASATVLVAEVPPKRVIGRPFQKGHTLSKGRGRPKGALEKRTKEIRECARRLLEDPKYVRALERRLREGSAQHIEQLLYYYAYGKPADRVKIMGALGTFDLVGALQQAWTQIRGGDPRANGGTPKALPANGH